MKKKNVIGHMEASKEHSVGWFRRLGILPRLICLFLAALIWLAIVNVTAKGDSSDPQNTNNTQQESLVQ